MKKLKRVGAWLGIVLLLGFAAGALIFSMIDAPWARTALSICLYLAIMAPVLIYAMMLTAKVLRRRSDSKADAGDGPKEENES